MTLQEKSHIFISSVMSTIDLYCIYSLKVGIDFTDLTIYGYENIEYTCLDEIETALGIFEPEEFWVIGNFNAHDEEKDYFFTHTVESNDYSFTLTVKRGSSNE